MTMKPNGAQARVIGSSPAAAALQPASEAEEGDENAITSEPPAVHEASEAPGPSRQRSSPPKRKLVAALSIADGDMPFAKFCEGKDPKDWAAKIVLGGIWMRDHRERAEFNADDIYTCLRHQWNAAPEDLPQMLRDMTRRELLDKGATRGGFTLSIMSEKKLKKMDNGG